MSNMYKSFFLILVTIAFTTNAVSQDTLRLDDYLEIVDEQHPLIQKANLFEDVAEAYSLKAQGVLDPKIESSYDRKRFKDTPYFTVWQTEAKIPTRYPIDLSVGYEKNEGVFLSDQNFVPNNGLVYGTINVTLLRGLIFDEQRFNIQNADLNALMGEVEGEIIRREVFFQAVDAYLKWSATQEKANVFADFLGTLQQRHQNIIELFENGDKPAIDTIESRVNLNTAQKLLLEARQDLLKAQQKAALFLWDDNGNPLSIRPDVAAENLVSSVLNIEEKAIIVNPLFAVDPLVRKMDNKISQINLNNRLIRENLKPELNLKYNTIIDLGDADLEPRFSFNDYKYGITANIPILNRKTRGDIMLNEVKIEQTIFERSLYEQKLFNEYTMLIANQDLQTQTLDVSLEKFDNSQSLLAAEIIKFDLGESSVFMLNTRERKLLEARLEILKSYTKIGKTAASLYFLKMGQ